MQNKKTDLEKLFVILILFGGLALAYLLGTAAESPTVVQPAVREISPELRNVNLDLTLLDNILFKQLRVFGIIPVSPGQTGRENPFLPF